jgi:hypothetical protein
MQGCLGNLSRFAVLSGDALLALCIKPRRMASRGVVEVFTQTPHNLHTPLLDCPQGEQGGEDGWYRQEEFRRAG